MSLFLSYHIYVGDLLCFSTEPLNGLTRDILRFFIISKKYIGHHSSGSVYFTPTTAVVLYTLPPPQLPYCILYPHHSCGIVYFTPTTAAVLYTLPPPQLPYCILYPHHSCGTKSFTATSIPVASNRQTSR